MSTSSPWRAAPPPLTHIEPLRASSFGPAPQRRPPRLIVCPQDNALVKVADPDLIGACLAHGADAGAKACRAASAADPSRPPRLRPLRLRRPPPPGVVPAGAAQSLSDGGDWRFRPPRPGRRVIRTGGPRGGAVRGAAAVRRGVHGAPPGHGRPGGRAHGGAALQCARRPSPLPHARPPA